MRFVRTAAATLFLLTNLAACSEAKIKDPYGERDGEAEALADISSGAPLKLYFHEYNGVVPAWRTPGLLSCEPDKPVGSRVFRGLEAADWHEGETYTAEESRRQGSAWSFARAYNRTVYGARAKDVAAVCPEARLE